MKIQSPEIRDRESASQIDDAAAAWVARTDRGGLSSDEEAEFETWLGGDTRRAGAYARALAIHSHFDRAVGLGPDFLPTDTGGETQTPHDEARKDVISGAGGVSPDRIHRRRFLFAGGMAAAASVALAFVGYEQLVTRSEISTAMGDMRRVNLAEGSAITLNTQSVVDPKMQESLREVALLKGEAIFNVSRDEKRPFVVRAGSVDVRVLGTSFAVRRFDDGSVDVTVISGKVEVIPLDGSARRQLTRAQKARFLPQRGLQTASLSSTELRRTLSWQAGLLDLDGMSMRDAVREYARYSDMRIEFAEPAIGSMQITGVYSTSDPAGFARAAALSLGLDAEKTPAGFRLKRP